MALSVALVALLVWGAIPYGVREGVVFVLVPLPGLATALLADRRGVRWPLGLLGVFYTAVSILILMPIPVGLLWLAAAFAFPRGRRAPRP